MSLKRRNDKNADGGEPSGADLVALTSQITAKDRTVLAEIGETCERVPATSLPWLLEQGYIGPKSEAAKE